MAWLILTVAVIFMADLNRDLRLAVDTGKVTIGTREVAKAVQGDSTKLVVIASAGKKESIEDISHMCNVAGIKTVKFTGSSMDLGTVCGKPYSINAVAVIEPGNSNILNESYA